MRLSYLCAIVRSLLYMTRIDFCLMHMSYYDKEQTICTQLRYAYFYFLDCVKNESKPY